MGDQTSGVTVDVDDPTSWKVERRSDGGSFYWVSVDGIGESRLRAENAKDAKALLTQYRMKYGEERLIAAAIVAAQQERETIGDVVTVSHIEEGANVVAETDGTSETTTDVVVTVGGETETSTVDAPSVLEQLSNDVDALATVPSTETGKTATGRTRKNAEYSQEEVENFRTERARLYAAGTREGYKRDLAVEPLSADEQRMRFLTNVLRDVSRLSGATTTRTTTKTVKPSSTASGKLDQTQTPLYTMRAVERDIRTLLHGFAPGYMVAALDEYSALLAERYASMITPSAQSCTLYGAAIVGADGAAVCDVDGIPQYVTTERIMRIAPPVTVKLAVTEEVATFVAELTPDLMAQFRQFQAMLAAQAKKSA